MAWNRRSGLTLVEVVAGLVLMGSLAVGVVLAYSSHQRQIRVAAERLAAIPIADELLADWYGRGSRLPTDRQGAIRVDGTEWRWATRLLRIEKQNGARFQVVRLQLFASYSRSPACSVELTQPLAETTP